MDQLTRRRARRGSYFGPVKDGRSLPRDPFDPDAPPLSAAVPMVLGNTHDETRGLMAAAIPTLFDLTWDTLLAKLDGQLAVHGRSRSRQCHRDLPTMYPHYSPADVFFASTTASRSWRGQVIEAERRAAQAEAAAHTWVYQFDWGTPGARRPLEGVSRPRHPAGVRQRGARAADDRDGTRRPARRGAR